MRAGEVIATVSQGHEIKVLDYIGSGEKKGARVVRAGGDFR
jgi:hypothetical protein